MGKKRRRFSSEFKARVALASVRGEKTLTELASEFEVHANQVAPLEAATDGGRRGSL